MEDFEVCALLATVAETESVETALEVARDIGITTDEAMFDLEYMGVIR